MADIQKRSDASAIVYNHVGAFEYNPHHVPAVLIKVGFRVAHESQPYPSSYMYVASNTLLWTFFTKWGMVVESRRM
jgi:hypothetical protein